MGLSILPIGGYGEVGRNSTAIIVDDEVVILDLGLHLEHWIEHTEDEDIKNITSKKLIEVGAIPDVTQLGDLAKNVVGIVPSHAHLDHIGAVPFLAGRFPEAPVVCTPFSAEVLKAIVADEGMVFKNEIIAINVNSSYKLTKKITVELINITHSVPQTAVVVLHTPYGRVAYGNDYKLDPNPTFGLKTNLQRLEELAGVEVFISECLYADDHRRMPSESIAREMLRHALLEENTKGKGLIVSTFSSHIARVRSIVECGEKLNRKIVFFGRSLAKYTTAAENLGLVDFSKRVKMIRYADKVEKMFKKIMKEGKDKYLLVVTGHQGEPQGVLSKMADKKFSFRFDDQDHVIFSCQIIPTDLTRKNRAELERKLHSFHVRCFSDIHASGHAAREDLRDMLRLLKPKHVVPTHAGQDRQEAFASLAQEEGYSRKQIHILANGQRFDVPLK